MKKILIGGGLAVITALVLFAAPVSAATTWDVTGTYSINVNYLSVDYPETLVLTQSGTAITGVSLDTIPSASYFAVTGGSVVGNDITINANQGALLIQMVGTIKPNGSMSGNWHDVTEQLGSRVGTWETTAGTAKAIAEEETCFEIVLTSSTNTQFVGLTETDPSGLSGPFSLGTPGAAVVAGPDGFPGAWDAAAANPNVMGASWVNNMASAPGNPPVASGDGQDGTKDTWRLFSDSFTIPAGATSISSPILHFTADNSVEAFLNDTSIGSAPNYTTVADSSPLTISAGTHTFKFVTKNDAYDGQYNPTGLLYKATIEYCIPNTLPPTTGAISGMKYNDLNRNGQKDTNELGLGGWTIRLILDNETANGKEDEDGETVVATATTDSSGNYSFTNVAPGTYEVRETHQKGWKRMSKNPKDIVIVAGSEVAGVDFGNAVKQKKEKEDTDKDDDRDEESGFYYAGDHENDYGRDHDNKEHRTEQGNNHD